MKNYAEIYVSLREEIMQQIDLLVDNLLEKYDVECISDLENAPVFQVYVTEYIDDGLGHSEPTLIRVTIEEIFVGGEITVIDDLCDGGGTFVGIASELRELNPTKLRLVITHAVNYDGILKVADVYDEVVITNSYKNWGVNEILPDNVRVIDIISKL